MTSEFNFKKYLYIFLGIILLVANTQTFSQGENVVSEIVSQQEIEELSAMAKRIRIEYKRTLKGRHKRLY